MYRFTFATPGGNHADWTVGRTDEGDWRIAVYSHGFGPNWQTSAETLTEALAFVTREMDELAQGYVTAVAEAD